MPPKRGRPATRTNSSVFVVQETTEQTPPPVQETVEQTPLPVLEITEKPPKRPNLTADDIVGKQEWQLFSQLVDGSNATLAEQPAKNAMSILASTFKTPLDVIQHQLEVKNKIVIKRVGAKIIAHHVDNSSLTFTMPDLSQPISWVNMLQDILTQRKVPSPIQPAVSHQMQLLLALCARLPPIRKLIVHKQKQEIVLNIIGTGFDAIVRIVGGQVIENRRFTQFCVPWRNVPQANTALGTQILMIADDATTIYVEIMSTPAGGYIGVHDYGVVRFMCLSLTNAMVKYRLSKPTLIMLNTINPSLVVLKTPNSTFHGVVERIEKKNRESLWLEGGRRFAWSDIENLDTVLSEFSLQGKL
jgi:hypothetical protein